MNLPEKHPRYFIFRYRTAIELVYPRVTEGYLGMSEKLLPIFREKKAGTSVNTKSSSIYSAFHSPPPIRPMVEKIPYVEIPERKNEICNLMEESA